jgi:regulator of replication initiation timing
MSTELSDVKLQLQKIEYESKESAINVESLKETNQDLHTELEELKKSLEAVRSAQKVNVDEEKIKRKADKMAEMMAGFDPSVRLLNLLISAMYILKGYLIHLCYHLSPQIGRDFRKGKANPRCAVQIRFRKVQRSYDNGGHCSAATGVSRI